MVMNMYLQYVTVYHSFNQFFFCNRQCKVSKTTLKRHRRINDEQEVISIHKSNNLKCTKCCVGAHNVLYFVR